MQEHSFHKEGFDLGGSPESRKNVTGGQAEMGKPVRYEQVEADYRDQTIQSFAQSILRLGQECRTLADENKALKVNVERLKDLSDNLMAQLNFGMDDWQPIETAPMDGTDILCFCVEPEFEGEENPWTEMRVCFYGILTEGESCWMSHYGYIQRPTHWMSLPKPPIA